MKMEREEGVYITKRVSKLPKRGNANYKYVIKGEEFDKFYLWLNGKYEEVLNESSGGRTFVEGESVTGTGTEEDPYVVGGSGAGGSPSVNIVPTWEANTDYVEGQLVIKPDVDNNTVIRRIADGTSGVDWLVDYANWEKVSQGKILAYTGSATKMEGEIFFDGTDTYQSNITDQTRAGFDGIEQTKWTKIASVA